MCIDLWRRQEVERAWLDTLGTCAGATAPSAEQQAIIVETLLQAAQMLQQLPPKVARAFILAQVDGMKYRDIAAELGVSERTIKSYLARPCCIARCWKPHTRPPRNPGIFRRPRARRRRPSHGLARAARRPARRRRPPQPGTGRRLVRAAAR
ncbi:sigma factor-like helix-turn-helix DNA-binding protein [Achromobacter insuavis]